MSGSMYGADSEQLDLLSTRLQSSGDELQSLLVGSAGAVALATLGSNISVLWKGPRALNFASVWEARHLLKLRGLEQMLQEAARTATANAEEQRNASMENGRRPTAPEYGVALPASPFVAQPPTGEVVGGIVDDAYERVHNLLSTDAILDVSVTHRDLDEIKDIIAGLSEAERVALFNRLSSEDLKTLLYEINDHYDYPASKAEFWRMVVPFLDIDQKRRIFGDQWAQVYEMGTVGAQEDGNFLASFYSDMANGTHGDKIPEDEIEIRQLGNGKWIVILPGVTDLSDGLESGKDAAIAVGGGPLAATAGTLAARDVWNDPNPEGSARDMRYATDSLRSTTNTSQSGANSYAFAVKEAMQSAGIPAGADVMMVGHSFGSMTATDLAGDTSFNLASNQGLAQSDAYYVNVDTVVAAGAYSPQSTGRVPDGVDVLNLQSVNDLAVQMEVADLQRHAVVNRGIVKTESSAIYFDGGSDGFGHSETNYAHFLEQMSSPGDYEPGSDGDRFASQVADFEQAAADDYNGEAKVYRVNVKDAYSDPRLSNKNTGA